jgi:hypothetical protein
MVENIWNEQFGCSDDSVLTSMVDNKTILMRKVAETKCVHYRSEN